MAAAIFAVTLVLGFGGMAWLIRYESRRIEKALVETVSGFDQDFEVLHGRTTEIRDVLKEASRLKALRAESPDDRATIPARGSLRYVPIARQRAKAERQSLGPVTHQQQVRENNAKAIESAG